ncbi:MAG: carbon-nitrogen hydrolase [Deltaproteobacteria bacterium]|nr:carbon-nitrogen hydrolase [Deltaproteobacteria bacterium]
MAAPRRCRVALAQQRADPDPARNLKRAEEALRAAAEAGAQVACLQELFRTPYFPQSETAASFDLAEPVPGPTSEQMSALARELGLVIVAPVFERRAAGVYHNTALVIDADGRLLGQYRKMHIPHDPGFYEKYYFTPGDGGFPCFDTAAGRIGVAICWDQWFPEAARLLALGGAELVLYPTAIGWSESDDEEERATQRESWVAVQRGHAISNGVFVAAVNRTGREGALDFFGSSFVFDPRGRLLGQSPVDAEDLLVVDCDFAEIETTRREWPLLRDRRIDAYGDLTRRYRS